MAVATKTDHILSTLRAYLDDDAALSVIKVWDDNAKATSSVALCYVWPIVDEYGTLAFERGISSPVQTMRVGVWIGFYKGAKDAARAGTLATKYAEVSERVEARIDALNLALQSDPVMDTTTVGSYRVGIHGVEIASRSGITDDERTAASCVIELRVHYLTVKL